MPEIWLHGNRRVLALALVPVAALGLTGAGLVMAAATTVVHGLGWAAATASGVLAVGVLTQMRRPRIAFDDGSVLFYLRAGKPVAVPANVVEAFFLGQGAAGLPAVGGRQPEAVNLVARLSQTAPEWDHVDVKPALGAWCNHYATIRGAWCEPLTTEVIRRLNKRLHEIHESLKQPAESAS